VQPTVSLKADGGARTEVKVGQPVSFTAIAEQPPEAGTIVAADWDFEGVGAYRPAEPRVDGSQARVEIAATHAYAKPGVYFACFRAGGHCDGAAGKGLPVQNLARVRVVVSA
jgi:hypothetical protein